jgi:hypothetical protein
LKGQIASLLIVVALIVGAGVGYFGSSTTTKTTTETVIRTYTTTLPGESGVERCVISGYTVWAVEEASSIEQLNHSRDFNTELCHPDIPDLDFGGAVGGV